MRTKTYSLVEMMPERRQVTARGLLIAIAIGALLGTIAALWPKPGFLP